MSKGLVSLTLHIQETVAKSHLEHYLAPRTTVSCHAPFRIVRSMELPDGEVIDNPIYIYGKATFQIATGTKTESITLLRTKATKLTDLYRGLRSGHLLQCHDVVERLEGWENELKISIARKGVQPPVWVSEPEIDIKPG